VSLQDVEYVFYSACVAPLLVLGVRWLVLWAFSLIKKWGSV